MSKKSLVPLDLAKTALSLLQEGSDSEDEILALSLVTSAVALHLLKQPRFTKRRRIPVHYEKDSNTNFRTPSPPRERIQRRSTPRFEFQDEYENETYDAPIEDKETECKIELNPVVLQSDNEGHTKRRRTVDQSDNNSQSSSKKKRPWSKLEDDRRRLLLGLSPTDTIDQFCGEPKITDYMSMFLDSLKMDISTFNLLLSYVRKDIEPQSTCMRQPVAAEQRLAVLLRYLSTGESFTSMENTIKLSRSFLSVNMPAVCRAIESNLKNQYIKLPTCEEEWATKAEEFENKWNYPLCLGALTRRHFKFKSPRTANVLGLIDANCKFMHVDIEKEDETIYLGQENAPPPQSIGNNRILPYVFIADTGFDLDDHIMIPFTYTDTVARRQFNERLRASAQVTDQTFQILVERFKILSSQLCVLQPHVEEIIKTCCVLHNFLMDHNPELYTKDLSDKDDFVGPDLITLCDPSNLNHGAEAVREEFADYFANEGHIQTFDAPLYDEDEAASHLLVDVMSL